MTREESMKQNARKYAESLADSLCFGDSPITRARIHAFIKGAEYADEHPRKGLWDSEKVIDYIYHHAHVRTFGDIVIDDMSVTEFIETMKKAMEE